MGDPLSKYLKYINFYLLKAISKRGASSFVNVEKNKKICGAKKNKKAAAAAAAADDDDVPNFHVPLTKGWALRKGTICSVH